MSKKQKRSVSGNSARKNSSRPVTASAAAGAPTSGGTPPVRRFSANSAVEFNPDYSYVKAGLKRIGKLVVVFLVAMIVLKFIIH